MLTSNTNGPAISPAPLRQRLKLPASQFCNPWKLAGPSKLDNVEAELSESPVERSDEVNTRFTVAGEQPITRAIWRKPAPSPAIRWAPNTRKAYVPGWNGFTIWCVENRCPGLPSSPADVGSYLEHLVETEGQSLATARTRLAAIAAAHRLGRHPDPGADPLGRSNAETAGQGVCTSPPAGQGIDVRGPGRHQGHGADSARPPGQAPAQGDRGPGGGTRSGGQVLPG